MFGWYGGSARRLSPVLLLMLAACVPPGARRHFRFKYDVTVTDLPASAQVIDIWLPVPPETPQQDVRQVSIESPGGGECKLESMYGNRVWHARLPRPTSGTINLTLWAEIVRREQSVGLSEKQTSRLKSEEFERFLEPNDMVPLTDRFASIAEEQTLGIGGPMDRSRAIYDYVLDRMSYDKSGDGWGRGDANYACDVGAGNCTDFHSLFIALHRSLDTPARFWIGFPLPAERGEGEIGGYHCWAEFWLPDVGWVPVDISEADKHPEKAEYFFGNVDENRVVFTLGRDLVLPPGQKGPPVNFFVYPYVEVDGKVWDKVQRRFSFKDLP
jgi:transglutaminase-like putative cysteine protease